MSNKNQVKQDEKRLTKEEITKEELKNVAGGRDLGGKTNLAGVGKLGGNVTDPKLPGNLPHVPTRVP
jgi:bacteriocin-like protein